ncbi:MAG TPA: translation initiation factor IF-2 [Gemmatimonadaceae bacterium]|nr:translation initiation factor IF-2 [Gemmatimonadaceae bacterium]
MSKLRVHDLAGEFGIPADEVVGLLRQMDVPVRSHLSLLTDDQVARLRARWEREKRVRAERKDAPAAPSRRRRTAAADTPPDAAAAPKAAPKPAKAPKATHAKPPAAAPAEAAPVAEEPAAAGAPVRRRRKAADVAAAAAEAAVKAAEEEAAAEAAAAADAAAKLAAEAAIELEEAQYEEMPEVEAPEAFTGSDEMAETAAAEEPMTHMESRSAPQRPEGGAPSGRERPRPRPVTPGAPRPRSGGGGSSFMPPRPVASAAPGGGIAAPPRREDKGQAKPGGGAPDRTRRKKGRRGTVDQGAVDANISKTMAAMRGAPSRRSSSDARRGHREEAEAARVAEAEREKRLVRVNEFITVSELAQILKVPATEIVSFAFKNLGLMITINQRLDFDQIELIAGEFGFQAVREDAYQAEDVAAQPADRPEDLVSRPPVVTIMGHVDHGKTSLLDFIRRANVVAGESGGITQHIGAYHVSLPNRKSITFLDTPGHEAFTAMRARGAQVTDIVVLVVAADDAVMPQTIEAISHARNAGVPMIVAINKVDLPQANPAKVKQDLLQQGVVLEEFGGQTLSSEISAKKGTNIETLLDQILLQAEILDLKANPSKSATGSVVEAQLDPGKGPVATVLIQSGTLHVGDHFICGMHSGRVRALLDERGNVVKDAGPAIPVQVLGVEGVPMAGDQLLVVDDASAAREIAQRRQRLDREAKSRRTSRGVSLEDFIEHAASGERRTLRILIKADQGGPAEALADALQQLSTGEVQVEVVHRGVGAISESDILLAKASGAIIIGFHVRPDNNARTAAEREGVDIKLYRIIYEAVADVRAALEGMLRPERREVVFGEAEAREIFKVSRIGTIAGCYVRSGVINRQGRVRVIRDGVEIYDGAISSLRRFKDDVREVKDGFECGIGIENFNDIKVGDVIECYRTEEIARSLGSSPAT